MTVQLDTSEVAPAQRSEFWAAGTARLLGPIGIRTLVERPFSGRILGHHVERRVDDVERVLDVVRGQVEQLVRGHRVRPPRAHGILQALGGLLRHQTESIGVSGRTGMSSPTQFGNAPSYRSATMRPWCTATTA